MRNYDLTLILSPLLSPQEANDLFQGMVSFVQEAGGILQNQRLLGKKPLLAPAKKAREGYLGTIAFSLNEESLAAVTKKCQETSEILRYLLTKVEKKKQPKLAPPLWESSREQEKKERVDLKEIDKKLEEIFKETV